MVCNSSSYAVMMVGGYAVMMVGYATGQSYWDITVYVMDYYGIPYGMGI